MKHSAVRKKQKGNSNHKLSKDLLKEEFGPELGDFNVTKAFEGAIEAKTKKHQIKNKKIIKKKRADG